MQVEFREIKLVTRAFPGTANPNPGWDDLAMDCVRPPSIIGGLRWWFRAIAGGVLKEKGTLKNIQDNEGRLFGSTSIASPIRISTSWEGVPNRDGGVGANFSPIGYLAFGKTNQQAYLPSDFPFKVHLRSNCPESLKLASCLLDLWIAFGGVGGRWRHGLSSMTIENSRHSDPVVLLDEARRAMQPWLKTTGNETMEGPRFAVAHPAFLTISRFRPDNVRNEEEALGFCERTWRDYRFADQWSKPKNKDRHGIIKEASSKVQHTQNSGAFHGVLLNPATTRNPTVRFSMLGMPIPFSVWNPREEKRSKAMLVWDQESGGGRLASPIWLRPKVEGGKWSVYALGWKYDAARGRDLRLAYNAKTPRRGTLATADRNQAEQVDDYFQYLANLGWTGIAWPKETNQ